MTQYALKPTNDYDFFYSLEACQSHSVSLFLPLGCTRFHLLRFENFNRYTIITETIVKNHH